MKILVVVDMQNDFVDGALGSKEAEAIVDKVVQKIKDHNDEIIVTIDTHYEDYLDTPEGKKLPVKHCIKDTPGWYLNKSIGKALEDYRMTHKKDFCSIYKDFFGDEQIVYTVKRMCVAELAEDVEVEFVGLCTDICVICNALLLKNIMPELNISVDASCCAGSTPEKHKAALEVMESCQIDIKKGTE